MTLQRHRDARSRRPTASSGSTSRRPARATSSRSPGLPEVTIGDTLTDPADPRPLPRLDVDAPTLRMTFGVNTSPLSGREGKYVTCRQIKARLDREVLGNVSIEVHPTESGDTFEVRGRGELQLAVLIEQMRREGFELTVSRPEVLLHDVGGEVQEPYERITIDIPPDYIGEVQQALAGRKGRLEQMTTDADGRVRMEFVLPVRGLIGYRGQLLTDTRGTALLHQIGEGYGPWAGEVTHRTNGVLVADRPGTSNAYGLFNLQERSELFIGAGEEVYEGMIVGENSRSGDMDVNPTKEKKLTNIRTHAHDEALRLTPPRPLTLESAIEFIAADELVEVTPQSIRLRKRSLSQHDRRREQGREEDRRLAAERDAAPSLTPDPRLSPGSPAGPGRRRRRRPELDDRRVGREPGRVRAVEVDEDGPIERTLVDGGGLDAADLGRRSPAPGVVAFLDAPRPAEGAIGRDEQLGDPVARPPGGLEHEARHDHDGGRDDRRQRDEARCVHRPPPRLARLSRATQAVEAAGAGEAARCRRDPGSGAATPGPVEARQASCWRSWRTSRSAWRRSSRASSSQRPALPSWAYVR